MTDSTGQRSDSPIVHPTPAVDIIVRDRDGAILLGRLAPQWTSDGEFLWGLPGREIAFGENLRIAVERNLDEELGLQLVRAEVATINTNFGFGNHYLCVGVVATVQGTPVNNKPDDWVDWKWFKPDELPQALFPSAHRTLTAFRRGSISLDF